MSPGSAVGIDDDDGGLRSLCWTSANVVPIECDEVALDLFAGRLRRQRRRSSSIFGLADQVLPLWARLQRHWGQPRSFRPDQPMLAVSTLPSEAGLERHPGSASPAPTSSTWCCPPRPRCSPRRSATRPTSAATATTARSWRR
ncbi:DUF4081 domain-containing protein [Barrientosiimonas endolithica]|uniref:DUF4081 domain-containing protein n=1 Tax=Barrientosiimonas endolithica TaxID=1535208 RepID=A0ABM8HCB5_9MICO|nr:DUF4081 domain-containing protein [Barrientosiimonas endolithica]BDZ58605.1 hypothetical protein GCM10025872_22620 [Barrientosiimonas endolithica]